MTEKITKIFHNNVEYELGNSTDQNYQVIKFEDKPYSNKYAEGKLLLYKIAGDIVAVKLKLYEAYTSATSLNFPGMIRQEFIPKSDRVFRYNIDGVTLTLWIKSNGGFVIDTNDTKIERKYNRSYEPEALYSITDTDV